MKKASAGIVCILLAIVIAVFSVGCNGGGELTYTGDSQQSSSDNITPVGSSEQPASSEPSTTQSSASTVLYQLTTQQGETVQVLTTSAPLTETPTMNYDPVTVPVMPTTTYYTTAPYTTQYVAPTYSPNADNQVTTKAPTTTTTQATTEKQTKYVNVDGNSNDGSISGNNIVVSLENVFGKEITATKGNLKVKLGNQEYSRSYSVKATSNNVSQVDIVIKVDPELSKVIDNSAGQFMYVEVPRGAVISSDKISNNKVIITIVI